MFYVVNFYRPLTTTVDEAITVMREIENACGLSFTGIINNSNLGAETTLEKIKATYERAKELSLAVNLPIVYVSAEESIAKEDMVAISLQKRPFEI